MEKDLKRYEYLGTFRSNFSLNFNSSKSFLNPNEMLHYRIQKKITPNFPGTFLLRAGCRAMLQGVYIKASGPLEVKASADDFSPTPIPLSFGNSKKGFLNFCFQPHIPRFPYFSRHLEMQEAKGKSE